MNELNSELPHDDLDDFLSVQLRDVPVPTGLKEKLLAIAEQEPVPVSPVIRVARERVIWRRLGWFAALAATGLISFFIWRQIPIESAPVNQVTASKIETDLKQWLVENEKKMESLRNDIAALELEETVTGHETKRVRPIPELSDRETISLAFALSGELMHEWAGVTPAVEEQLNQVVRSFPETKGSELAARILAN